MSFFLLRHCVTVSHPRSELLNLLVKGILLSCIQSLITRLSNILNVNDLLITVITMCVTDGWLITAHMYYRYGFIGRT